MTLERVSDLILGNLGVLVLLLFILYGGSRGWWVFGWYAKELRDRNTILENRLDRALGTGERLAGSADRATRLAEDRQAEVSGG